MANAETIHRGRQFSITPSVQGFSEQQKQRESQPYRRRLEIDERHAQMRDAERTKEVWE